MTSYYCNNKDNNNKILLLATNKMLLLLHKMLFSYYGYKVSAVSRPEVVCDYLKKYRPDLVVFDMEIKEHLCRKIAALLKKERIPTLLIISSGDECNVCKYLEPGLCDYVDSLSDELNLIIKKSKRLITINYVGAT